MAASSSISDLPGNGTTSRDGGTGRTRPHSSEPTVTLRWVLVPEVFRPAEGAAWPSITTQSTRMLPSALRQLGIGLGENGQLGDKGAVNFVAPGS